MRLVVRKILAMAYEKKISDKQFRIAIQSLIKKPMIRKGVIAALDELREEAIIETERDEFVH